MTRIDYSQFDLAKGRTRVEDRIEKKAALAKQERLCRAHVRLRDRNICRVCRRYGNHLHHLQRRSGGGKWTPTNIVTLCATCHGFEHAALLRITGNPDIVGGLSIGHSGAASAYLRGAREYGEKKSNRSRHPEPRNAAGRID